MVQKVKISIVLLSIFIFAVFTGCAHDDTESQYYTAAKQFNKIYFETVGNLETADALKTMKNLQTEESKKSIEALGKLLEPIKKNIPKEREKLYDSFKSRYEDLVFLSESYDRFNELTQEEKRKIGIALVNMGLNVENWKDKRSTIVWE